MACPFDEFVAPSAKESMTPSVKEYMASHLDFCIAYPVLCSSSGGLQVSPCRSGSWDYDSEDDLSGGVAV